VSQGVSSTFSGVIEPGSTKSLSISPRLGFPKLSVDAQGALADYNFEVAIDTREMTPPKATPTLTAADGIIYRTPSSVVVYVCRSSCFDNGAPLTSNVVATKRFAALIPGREAWIPIRRGWLNERATDLGFAAGGTLDSVSAASAPPATESKSASEATSSRGEVAPSELKGTPPGM
jgi:hypothetical protein